MVMSRLMLGFTASSMKNVRYWRYLNSRRKLAFSAQRLSQKIIPSSTPQTDEFLGWRPTQMNYGGSASFHLRIYNYPGRSRCPFSRDEARENGFTGERRGEAFTRSIAQKSAASPQHVHPALKLMGKNCHVWQNSFVLLQNEHDRPEKNKQ